MHEILPEKGARVRHDAADYEACRAYAKRMRDVGHAIMRKHDLAWRGSREFFLSLKAEPATLEDKQVSMDLLDTLKAHETECVGMAANPFQTEEGCLSLIGVRKCTRYEEIEVRYQDINFKQQRQKLSESHAI